MSVIMGDFNARASTWGNYDIFNHEGVQIDSIVTMHGLQQLISDPNHILYNSLFYVNLIS